MKDRCRSFEITVQQNSHKNSNKKKNGEEKGPRARVLATTVV